MREMEEMREVGVVEEMEEMGEMGKKRRVAKRNPPQLLITHYSLLTTLSE